MNASPESRYANQDYGKFACSVWFISTSFLYLIAGIIFTILRETAVITIPMDSLFMSELYGFVTMMIFGASYIFVPGILKRTISKGLCKFEYAAMNAGVLAILGAGFLAGSTGPLLSRYLFAPAMILILVASLVHLINMTGLNFRSIKTRGEN